MFEVNIIDICLLKDWFTDCAGFISRVRGTPVEWNTPMNLPVIQPYYREVRIRVRCQHVTRVQQMNDVRVYLATRQGHLR
jgi:DNA-directed RNA polymerase